MLKNRSKPLEALYLVFITPEGSGIFSGDLTVKHHRVQLHGTLMEVILWDGTERDGGPCEGGGGFQEKGELKREKGSERRRDEMKRGGGERRGMEEKVTYSNS